MSCLFCNIVSGEEESKIIWEDDQFFVIKDIHPKTRIHVLVIPKRHIESVNHMGEKDVELVGALFFTAKRMAEQLGIADSGYRLLVNVGRGGGQIIDHLHLHLMAE